MTDHPLAHALLAELLQLDELDALLPLPILVNLHRAQLRTPFEGLLDVMATLPPLAVIPQQLAEKMIDALDEELNLRYSELDYGTIFADYKDLGWLESEAGKLRETSAERQVLVERHEFIEDLLYQHEITYKAYAPVITLLQLSWQLSPQMRENRLRALELELEVKSQVRVMLLDMAHLGSERLSKPIRTALG